jgi:hypothetical protein
MSKFRALAAEYGIFVEYERDRAGRDIGLHLTQPNGVGEGKIVTPALIWFQMKGIMASTLTVTEYKSSDDIPIDLDVAHLRFWYLNIQPTYLALYIECASQFLAIDLQKWVRDNYGDSILHLDQKTVRVRVSKKNNLDSEFFRIVLNQNLVPALRQSFKQENDRDIARFLRDSSVVQWLANCREVGQEARVVVIKYMSKMRTEVYFESRLPEGEWEQFRTHWEYAMGQLSQAFPYLKFTPEMSAELYRYSETIEDYDGREFEIWHEGFSVVDGATGEELEDDFDGECLFDLGNNQYSYGDSGGGEIFEHRIGIDLNETGERWAETLKALVGAEIISVDMQPHSISVAPWHARDA